MVVHACRLFRHLHRIRLSPKPTYDAEEENVPDISLDDVHHIAALLRDTSPDAFCKKAFSSEKAVLAFNAIRYAATTPASLLSRQNLPYRRYFVEHVAIFDINSLHAIAKLCSDPKRQPSVTTIAPFPTNTIENMYKNADPIQSTPGHTKLQNKPAGFGF